MEDLIKEIREKYSRPLIGIVGATHPQRTGYDPRMGQIIGYELRKHVGEKGGFLFTGGVEGVGIDVYRGIVAACQPAAESSEKEPEDDRFFVLTPTHVLSNLMNLMGELGGEDFGEIVKMPYALPYGYKTLAKRTRSKEIRIISAGESMDERRRCLSQLADSLVMVNGGVGTLDEVFGAIKYKRPVVSVTLTGGAASFLEVFKKTPDGFSELLEKLGYTSEELDVSLIHPVEDIPEMISTLDRLLYSDK